MTRVGLEGGFTLAELVVAAVVLFIAAIGVLQTLSMMVRHTERHQRDLEADQLLRGAIGYMRDVGYDGLIASGSGAIAAAIASQYATQLTGIAQGSSLALAMADTIPGKMLDATLSVSYPVDQSTQSVSLATRVTKGGPL